MESEYDIAIAGGGIAGLTAGLTAARLGRKTLILTGDVPGGQLLSIAKVDGFPGFPEGIPGYDLCPITQEQASAAGAVFEANELTSLEPHESRWRLTTGGNEAASVAALVIATGARLKELEIPGAVRLTGKGVSHCASCDAPLLRGRVAAVIGGGDSAMQEALTLAEFAARVFLLHRGEALSGQAAYRAQVKDNPKIELRLGCEVEEILGDDHVTGLRVRDRHRGAVSDLEAAGVFPYIGLRPNSDFLEGRLALDPRGAILTDGSMRTKLSGICAVGAVRSGWGGRAVLSAGEGGAAALAVDAYLQDGHWREPGNRREEADVIEVTHG